MKARRPYLNWPSVTFALGILAQLPTLLAYTKLGPPGLDDARTQLTVGVWFLFGSAYVLAATRADALGWMVRLFAKKGSTEAETRVRMVLAGGVCAAVGAWTFGRGLVLSDCHIEGFAVSCFGL